MPSADGQTEGPTDGQGESTIISTNFAGWGYKEEKCLPSSLKYFKTHFSRQLNCWSLRCSWSIACRRCSNYIFILNLTPGFNGLGKDNYKMRREAFQFWDLVRLILETLWYLHGGVPCWPVHVVSAWQGRSSHPVPPPTRWGPRNWSRGITHVRWH